MRTWQERELDERLRDEFKKRGFYQLGSSPIVFAPMPFGFKNRDNCTRFLKLTQADYKYVAYKNILVTTGFEGIEGVSEVGANVFIKLGSVTKEICPVIELTAFYHGRMYKYMNNCEPFIHEMYYADRRDDIQKAIDVLMEYAQMAIDTWWRSVRTLIVENRWPEEEYITDIKFLKDYEDVEHD